MAARNTVGRALIGRIVILLLPSFTEFYRVSIESRVDLGLWVDFAVASFFFVFAEIRLDIFIQVY